MSMDEPGLFDTQIVSYAFKGARELAVEGAGITSVTAQEFLLMQTRSLTHSAYYIPRPNAFIRRSEGIPVTVALKRLRKGAWWI
jgi:hypothetical protein